MVKAKKKTVFRKFKPLSEVEKAMAKAMRNLPHASFAKARIVERGVRDTTRTGYLNAAERADEICKEAGIEEGMRSKEVFTNYLWAKLDTGLARGNSTATYLRSALAFREKTEGRHAWPDDDDVRELVRCYNYAAKLSNGGKAQPMRGALTLDLLKQVMRAAAPNVALALATQYHACLRPHEVLSLTADCLSADQVRIDSNKKFRRTNAHKVGPVQRKPVSHAAKKILNLAVQRARTAQKAAGDRLFDLSLAQYRKAVAGAIKKSGVAMEGLAFVPHSVRHGRVVDWREANAPSIGLTEEQLALAGMSRGVSIRYGRTNAERMHIANGGEPDDSESSEDELLMSEDEEENEGDA